MRGRLHRVAALLRRPFVRDFSWLSISNQAAAVLSVITTMVLVRVVPVAEVGQVAFAQATAGLVMLVLNPRFQDAVQRYFPTLAMDSPPAAVALFWRFVRWDVVFGVSVATAVVGAWAIQVLPASALARPDFLALTIAGAGLASVVGTLNAGFAVTGGVSSLGRVSLPLVAVNAALSASGALLAGGLGYLAGCLVGTLLQIAVLLKMCTYRLPRAGGASRRGPLPAGLWRFLLSSSTATSLGAGSESALLVITGLGWGPTAVALMRVAQAPGRLVQSVFSPLAFQVFPRISRMAAEHDRVGIANLAGRTTKVVLAAGLLVVVAGAPVMQAAIELLYGTDYAIATLAALLFLLSGAVRAATIWAKTLPLAIGRPNLKLVVVMAESAVILAGTWLITLAVVAVPAAVTAIATLSVAVSVVLMGFWVYVSRSGNLLPHPPAMAGPAGAAVPSPTSPHAPDSRRPPWYASR